MKKSVKTIVLLVLFAALVGGYNLILQSNEKAQVSEESGSFSLTDKTAEDLTGITWTNNDTSYHFSKTDDGWHNADDADFPVNQDAVQSLADSLTELKANRKLENVANLADYGLDKPVFSVTGEWSDGTSTLYQMGDETPFADGYYLVLSNDESVYTVGSALDNMFSDTLTDLAQLEEMPVVENPSRLVVGAALNAYYKETSSFVNADQHWYSTPDDAALSDESVKALIETAQSLDWDGIVSANASDEELTEWRLTEDTATKLELYGDGESALKLFIGAADENGDYYARLANSEMVYTIAADGVSDILDADTSTLRNTDLIALDFDDLREAQFTSNAQSWIIERDETASDTDEDETTSGDEASDEASAEETIVTINGESGRLAEAENLWTLIESLTITEFDPSNADKGDILLSINVTSEARASASFEFYEHDAGSYLTQSSDGISALVSADTVDKIIRTLKQL